MMHPLFACRQLNAGPLQTQRLWSSNSMTLVIKLNDFGHQTQCYWTSNSMLLDITPTTNTKIGNIELSFLVNKLTSLQVV